MLLVETPVFAIGTSIPAAGIKTPMVGLEW